MRGGECTWIEGMKSDERRWQRGIDCAGAGGGGRKQRGKKEAKSKNEKDKGLRQYEAESGSSDVREFERLSGFKK